MSVHRHGNGEIIHTFHRGMVAGRAEELLKRTRLACATYEAIIALSKQVEKYAIEQGAHPGPIGRLIAVIENAHSEMFMVHDVADSLRGLASRPTTREAKKIADDARKLRPRRPTVASRRAVAR